MRNTPQMRAIAATIAALGYRGQANQARTQAQQATDPAERAHHEGRAVELDGQAREYLAKARDEATEVGATQYADTMARVLAHTMPDDPTAQPDALAQAEAILTAASLRIAGDLAPLYEHACGHIAAQLHNNSQHDPANQDGHEIYAVTIGDPTTGPRIDDQPTASVAVQVTHLRTHRGDLVAFLEQPEAALSLAQVHPTQVIAVVAEANAYQPDTDGNPDRTKPTDCRAVLIATPFGIYTYARTYDRDARTWGEPATRWLPTDQELPNENLTRALGTFYAIEMIAAQVLTEAPTPDDD